ILTEMDGFTGREGVIVLAATNRIDVLDPALLRPGRFDRRVTVGAPDQRGREAILGVHARGVPLAPEVDLASIAASTPAMVPPHRALRRLRGWSAPPRRTPSTKPRSWRQLAVAPTARCGTSPKRSKRSCSGLHGRSSCRRTSGSGRPITNPATRLSEWSYRAP